MELSQNRLSQKPAEKPEKESFLKNLERYDDIRALEIKEMQEEESYINNIKRQREKMETFKMELEKKERYYIEIEKENKRLKPYYEKFNQLKSMMEETLEKIERKEKENQKLKGLLEETNKQMDSLSNRFNQNENSSGMWKKECEKLQKIHKETEETFLVYKEQCNDKEKLLNEQIYNLKMNEKKIKDEMFQLQQDSIKKKEVLNNNSVLKEQNIQLEKENIQNLELLKLQKQKVNELEHICERLSRENEMLSQDLNDKKTNLMNHYKELESELEKQENIIKKQEKIINDFKNLKQDDERKIVHFKDEFILKDKELLRSKTLNNQLSEEYDNSVKKIQEFERELSEYRKENHELKRKLAIILEREESERIYRQEIEKVKLDILSARNNEVDKLNEAFDVVFPYSKINEKYNEDRIQSINSNSNKNQEAENSTSSGKKKQNNFNNYSENIE